MNVTIRSTDVPPHSSPKVTQESVELNSVLVHLEPRLKRALVWVLFAVLAVIGTLNLAYGYDNSFFLFLSFAAQVVVMFAPLVLGSRIGPLHVLAFPAIWWFVQSVVRQSGTIITGLNEHAALPNVTAGELNLLWANSYLLNCLAFVSFVVGYILARSARVPRVSLPPPTMIQTKVVVVLFGSFLCLLAYSQLVGGFEGMLLMRSVGRVARTEITGGGHFAVLLSVPSIVALLWYGFDARAIRTPLFIFTFVFGLACVFLVTGSRAAVLYPPILLLIAHTLHRRRLPRLSVIAPMVLVGWVVMGLVTIYRSSHFGKTSIDWLLFQDYDFADVLNAGSEELVNRSTTRSPGLPVLSHVPDDSPLLLGSTYLRVILAPIPQFFLPFEKPTAAGRLNGQMFFNIDAGVPVGAVIEAYWNFHVVGVVLVYILAGVFNSYVFRSFLANSDRRGVIGLYTLFLFHVGYDSDTATKFIQLSAIAAATMLLFCGMPRLHGWVRVRLPVAS